MPRKARRINYHVRLIVRAPRELRDRLQERAQREQRVLSSVVRDMLLAAVSDDGGPEEGAHGR